MSTPTVDVILGDSLARMFINNIQNFTQSLVRSAQAFDDNVHNLIVAEVLMETAEVTDKNDYFVTVRFTAESYQKLKELIQLLQNQNRQNYNRIFEDISSSAQKYENGGG